MFSKDFYKYRSTIEFKKRTIRSYSFSQANYNGGVCGSCHILTSNIHQGDATYDAARANMGSSCKMPTNDRAMELEDANYTWTTINGVNGRSSHLRLILLNIYFFH